MSARGGKAALARFSSNAAAQQQQQHQHVQLPHGAPGRPVSPVAKSVEGRKSPRLYGHQLRVGLPHKLYLSSDRVSPILDCMTRMHMGLRKLGDLRRIVSQTQLKTDRSEELRAGRSTSAAVRHTLESGQVVPPCIDERADSGLHVYEITREGFRCCMNCGLTLNQPTFSSNWKETHNKDGEDTTARADAPSTHSVVRDALSDECVTRKTCVGKGVARSMGLGHAVGLASSSGGSSTDERTLVLSEKQLRKRKGIIEETCKLVNAMAPVDRRIQEAVEATTCRVFALSVEHEKVCGMPNCDRSLKTQPARVIASKCFVHVVEELCRTGMAGVSQQTLVGLHQRMQLAPNFAQRDNATHNEKCALAVSSLLSVGPRAPCSPPQESTPVSFAASGSASSAAALDVAKPVPMRRNMSADAVIPVSNTVQVRDAIDGIIKDAKYASTMRDAALSALQDRDFSGMVKRGNIFPAGAGRELATPEVTAYLLLRAIQEEREGVSTARSLMDEQVCQYLQLSAQSAEAMVNHMKQALPAQARAAVAMDDELFAAA